MPRSSISHARTNQAPPPRARLNLSPIEIVAIHSSIIRSSSSPISPRDQLAMLKALRATLTELGLAQEARGYWYRHALRSAIQSGKVVPISRERAA